MAMVIDGTYIVSGKYGVHVEFDPCLSEIEYRNAVEELKQIGAVVIPHDSRYITNGDLQVLESYQRMQDALHNAQWDLENSEKESEEWIEALEEVENFKTELEAYLTLDYGEHFTVMDREKYKKNWGDYPDQGSIEYLINWYRAFANNDCVHVAIIPLNGDGLENWEYRITDLSFDYLDSVGGDLIPVPEICLLDREVIKILNENGYHVKDNAKFLEVAQ